MKKKTKKINQYVRGAVFNVEDILPFVFTKEVRHALRIAGHKYDSKEWKMASCRKYPIFIYGHRHIIEVPMGSHRYQLFVLKGTKCVKCGIEGTYFALERDRKCDPKRFHFNLYGNNNYGREVMITKDHIIPRAKGGRNSLTNYQPMCYYCNQKKADNILT